MSQEWDEVVHEVDLMIERLEAFERDLLAAVAGGKLTDRQRCSLCLLELHVEATSGTAEEGDTQE